MANMQLHFLYFYLKDAYPHYSAICYCCYNMKPDAITQQVWDPFDRIIQADSQDILKANKNLEKAIFHYQNHPFAPKCTMAITTLIAVILLLFFFEAAISDGSLLQGSNSEGAVIICLLILGIPGIYYSLIASTQSDWIGISLAKKYAWVFKAGAEDLPVSTNICPQITITEHSGGAAYTQFWGKLTGTFQQMPFWLGLLSGPTLFPDGSDKLQTVIVQLPHPATCALAISPRMIDNVLKEKSSFKSESSDFNKYFYIEDDYTGNDKNVFQVLTPPVLEGINELRVVCGRFRLIFYSGKAFFIFQEEFFKPKYTSLFKSTSLDQRDLDSFMLKIEKLTDLVGKVVSQVN